MTIFKKIIAVILSCIATLVLIGTIPGVRKMFSASSTEELLGMAIANSVLLLVIVATFKAAGWLWKEKQLTPPPLPATTSAGEP